MRSSSSIVIDSHKNNIVRRGPKFAITLDMAVENLRTAAHRINVTCLSRRLYDQHGSFCARTLQRKWGWRYLCAYAGLQSDIAGRKCSAKQPCIECDHRTRQLHRYHCRTCRRRFERLEHWREQSTSG
jgi:hypothetical protein